MLANFYNNHVLANLTFVMVLVLGIGSYSLLPRQQDPTINFNWIDITTVLPGASATDVEKQVTDVLERAIRKVSDIDFVQSSSKESTSSILVRFDDISDATFNKRVNDLRREIEGADRELPDAAEDPFILEITSSNAFPTVTLVISSAADDENLRRQSEIILKDIERIKGVDSILATGLNDPELQIQLHPERLTALNLSPTSVADSIQAYFNDRSAGSTNVGSQSWLIRQVGKISDPEYISSLPILAASGDVPIGSVADVVRAREKARYMVSYRDKPAVMFGVTKQANTNTITLVERVKDYIKKRNESKDLSGVSIELIDDQTLPTIDALNIMQTNALLGLFLVLIVAWAFLGFRIALLTAIGIPFILAGTFWVLYVVGETLNIMVLLGAVISLGMLVDDAVVVVEGIYYRLQRGMEGVEAAIDTLKEVFAPVTSAVLTTIAAFLPLMLLPGILGQFLSVVPFVVTVALAISLIEAYWMLPTHISVLHTRTKKPTRVQIIREQVLHRIRLTYSRWLIKVMRRPWMLIGPFIFAFFISMFFAFAGQADPQLYKVPVLGKLLVKTDFFASDNAKLFYINVEMPSGTPLEATIQKAAEVEKVAVKYVHEAELRDSVSYAGQMFTQTAPLQGDHYGQVFITLKPNSDETRDVPEIIDSMREAVTKVKGAEKVYFTEVKGGPPSGKPVSFKVRGDDLDEIRTAAKKLKDFMANTPGYFDISDNDVTGSSELTLQLNADAAKRAGVSPVDALRSVSMLVDGELVASMQDQGEELRLRVLSKDRELQDINEVMRFTMPTTNGGRIALNELFHTETSAGLGSIRHYNFRRAITVEADINKEIIPDIPQASAQIKAYWEANVTPTHPTLDLDFSGILDDLNEALGSILGLFLFGLLLMYVILGTQFKSYILPIIVIFTLFMAFTGVVLGLVISGNPLSLYTLYGIVALAGIAVNASIVLISAAQQRREQGMSLKHATIYAGRRRVIPILITSLTTVAGLFSLAAGLGGHSLIWGPVATAMVWGLAVSTFLTLFLIPTIYQIIMKWLPIFQDWLCQTFLNLKTRMGFPE